MVGTRSCRKPPDIGSCHSERSAESSIFNKLKILHFLQDDGKIGFAIAFKSRRL
jgi:hypothetical protein